MEQTITRYEALKLIETGEPFDLVFITADRRRGTGGQIKRVKGWLKVMRNSDDAPSGVGNLSKAMQSRDPRHFEHRTFNIFNPSNPADHAHKVHWRLMAFFNGKRIVQ